MESVSWHLKTLTETTSDGELVIYSKELTTTLRHLQCTGHMLINGNDNDFMRLAGRLGITLDVSGREQVFDSQEDSIAPRIKSVEKLLI